MYLLIDIVLILLDSVSLERRHRQRHSLFISLLCLSIMSSKPLKVQITLSMREPERFTRELCF